MKTEKKPPRVMYDWNRDTWQLRVWIDGKLEVHDKFSWAMYDELRRKRKNRGRFLNCLRELTKWSKK